MYEKSDIEGKSNDSDCSFDSSTIDDDPELKKDLEQANQEMLKLMEDEFEKIYNKKVVYNIFILVFIANILINIDHGTLPGCYE